MVYPMTTEETLSTHERYQANPGSRSESWASLSAIMLSPCQKLDAPEELSAHDLLKLARTCETESPPLRTKPPGETRINDSEANGQRANTVVESGEAALADGITL